LVVEFQWWRLKTRENFQWREFKSLNIGSQLKRLVDIQIWGLIDNFGFHLHDVVAGMSHDIAQPQYDTWLSYFKINIKQKSLVWERERRKQKKSGWKRQFISFQIIQTQDNHKRCIDNWFFVDPPKCPNWS